MGINDVPSRHLLGRLAREALDNAAALADEARVLLRKDRLARAYALAVLALEEYGKHMSCFGAATVSADAPRLLAHVLAQLPRPQGEVWSRPRRSVLIDPTAGER
jgi:hypothetical protein